MADQEIDRWPPACVLAAAYQYRREKTWRRKKANEADKFETLANSLNKLPVFHTRPVTRKSHQNASRGIFVVLLYLSVSGH
jgi:hypothetical protein